MKPDYKDVFLITAALFLTPKAPASEFSPPELPMLRRTTASEVTVLKPSAPLLKKTRTQIGFSFLVPCGKSFYFFSGSATLPCKTSHLESLSALTIPTDGVVIKTGDGASEKSDAHSFLGESENSATFPTLRRNKWDYYDEFALSSDYSLMLQANNTGNGRAFIGGQLGAKTQYLIDTDVELFRLSGAVRFSIVQAMTPKTRMGFDLFAEHGTRSLIGERRNGITTGIRWTLGFTP